MSDHRPSPVRLALLQRARQVLGRHAPGFDDALAQIPFSLGESAGSPLIGLFKQAGPVGLLLPRVAGGLGAGAWEAVQVQCALGARSPSLAVATTMHQFSVASLMALAREKGGAEALLLTAIARQRLLLSSAFAEGVPGRGILESSMTARCVPGGVLLSGSKKPCSLSQSMDLLTASYTRATPEGDELMVALIPAGAGGISRREFWANPALAGAESDELVLTDVEVSDKMIFSAGLKHRLAPVQVAGFIWFELLMSASYLGACAGLVEQVVEHGRWNDADRVALGMALQVGLSALEGLAREIDAGLDTPDDLLARLLLTRYAIEAQLAQASDSAHEMLGGMGFITSAESSLRLLACRGLRFHPPARISMAGNLADYLRGNPFSMAPRNNT